MKVSKNIYLQSFGVVVILLALYRCAVLERAGGVTEQNTADTTATASDTTAYGNTATASHNTLTAPRQADTITTRDITGYERSDMARHERRDMTGHEKRKPLPHPIYSVPSFKTTFPDTQDDHLIGVKRWGVKAVADRREAERRLSELVYIGASPYFHVETLRQSIPYLVPRAAILVNDIGRNFFDSLYVKGIPLHKIIITSALRTKDDVARLQRHNFNATENSCHLYGTTIDICYNRYVTVSSPEGPQRRKVQNDTLKWVLSEVLRDLRDRQRCYVKHEVKQGCFHITVKN